MMCMNTKRPTTYSVAFESKDSEVNWDKPIFEQEHPPHTGNYYASFLYGHLWSAYTSICSGDSGSPQMLFADTPKEPKFVVAAIASESVGSLFNRSSGSLYQAPCGTHTYVLEKSHNDQERVLRNIGISIKITYGQIFQWIKSKIQVP